nr:DUF397 domain-containing protein [Kitasatospora sp. NA04385]
MKSSCRDSNGGRCREAAPDSASAGAAPARNSKDPEGPAPAAPPPPPPPPAPHPGVGSGAARGSSRMAGRGSGGRLLDVKERQEQRG